MTIDQLNTFKMLKGKVNKGGIYIIEDILALDTERSKYIELHDNVQLFVVIFNFVFKFLMNFKLIKNFKF